MSESILITGGLGFIGARLARYLADKHKITIGTRKQPVESVKAIFGPSVSWIEHHHLLAAESFPPGITRVIHLAAMNEQECQHDPAGAMMVNIDQTRRILESSVAKSVTSFVYFSTVHVYGRNIDGKVLDETSPTNPATTYAITHRAAEDYVRAAHATGKIKGTVLRMSNAFGAPVLPDTNCWMLLVHDISRQATTQGKIQLRSDGSGHRDFLPMAAVERAVSDLIASDNHPDLLNLVHGSSVSVMQMAQRVAETASRILGKDVPILKQPGSGVEQTGFKVKTLLSGYESVPADGVAELDGLINFCRKEFVS